MQVLYNYELWGYENVEIVEHIHLKVILNVKSFFSVIYVFFFKEKSHTGRNCSPAQKNRIVHIL